MQGKSLLPILRGEVDCKFHKDVVLSEFHDSCNYNEGSGPPTHSVMSFDGRYKMVTYQGYDFGELYDLQNDPGEFCNLWDSCEHKDMKLEVMHQHVSAIMGSISSGPRRSTRY
jgi:hypothetical protein